MPSESTKVICKHHVFKIDRKNHQNKRHLKCKLHLQAEPSFSCINYALKRLKQHFNKKKFEKKDIQPGS